MLEADAPVLLSVYNTAGLKRATRKGRADPSRNLVRLTGP